MSFYATINGSIRFPTKTAIDAALDVLREKGWMNDRYEFVTERGVPLAPNPQDRTVDGLTLHIPWATYRNLSYVIDQLTAATTHRIAWTSTDGTSAAGVLIDGQETESHDLLEWAAEHVGPQEDGDEDDYLAEAEFEFINWARRQWRFDELSGGG